MSRILYLVAGEGNGHARRSAAVIEELKSRGHEVVAVSDRQAISILSDVADKVVEAVTPHMVYQDNRVLAWRTFFLNLSNLPKFIKDVFRIRRLSDSFDPAVVVTDFNPMGSFLAKRPLISIDNQGVITNADFEVPKGWIIEYLKSKLVVRLMVPCARARLVTCFWNAPMRINAVRIDPIVSRKIRDLRQKKGKHLLVYQTSTTNHDLAKLLPELDIEVRAYGFGKVGKTGKATFLPFDNNRWFDDLSSCRAVILNGGFSLISEALFLKKPILCFPIGHQFEQALNAFYLEKEGLGVWGKEQSATEVKRFLHQADLIQKKLSRVKLDHGSIRAADLIEKLIDSSQRKNFRS